MIHARPPPPENEPSPKVVSYRRLEHRGSLGRLIVQHKRGRRAFGPDRSIELRGVDRPDVHIANRNHLRELADPVKEPSEVVIRSV